MAAPAAGAQSLNVVHDFTGTDGATPSANMLLVPSASIGGGSILYGTAKSGGAYGQGTIFKVSSTGQFTKLYDFTGSWQDGANPNGPLVRDAQGNLYGTTNGDDTFYCGTVFKLSPAGQLILLYNFTDGYDGCQPSGPLVRDGNGNLYGTASSGGTPLGYGNGTVFKITPAGRFSVIYSFNGPDGADPVGSLALGADGNLYGTTALGGPGCDGYPNCGTVFKLTPGGQLTTLHLFAGYPNDGMWPNSGVVLDAQGNLYGTVYYGGTDYDGLVYKITPAGEYTVLHSFTGSPDGSAPRAIVTADQYGNLYSTTFSGGANNAGTIFKVTPQGQESVLYSFAGGSGGSSPYGGLVWAPSASIGGGTFYGTTQSGGSSGNGTIFKLVY